VGKYLKLLKEHDLYTDMLTLIIIASRVSY